MERYHLQELWCLHLYRYHSRVSVGGAEHEIRPGYLSVLPPSTDLVYWFKGRSEHLFAHFELPASRTTHPIPVMQDTGADFPHFYQMFEEAIGVFPLQPRRAEVRLWDLLWSASDAHRPERRDRIHPAVREVIRQIELRLHEPLLVESLAREVGLSHNHLTRLFHAATAQTIKGHLMTRRLEKARHLLQRSSTPIKAIAAEVGFGDLHAFNKAVRRRFQLSPRALRDYKSRPTA
jgi:AraC-like DNA-binding protein